MYRKTHVAYVRKYLKDPNIRMFVNFWYARAPGTQEITCWRLRYFLHRLVDRAVREIDYAIERGYTPLEWLNLHFANDTPSDPGNP